MFPAMFTLTAVLQYLTSKVTVYRQHPVAILVLLLFERKLGVTLTHGCTFLMTSFILQCYRHSDSTSFSDTDDMKMA